MLVSWEKTQGAGGLPYGSSGKLLSLLSGGIDSPVASWMMMRRGCAMDFLHMHAEHSVNNSKIMKLLSALREYSPKKLRMFAIPYNEFYKKSTQMEEKSELILFRRFILRLANRIAEEHGHLGVVTGDSVGQVASQTLENLLATNEISNIPVYRPLAGTGKQEIVDLGKRIGTYNISIEPYKDCCSLVAARHPSTRTKLVEIRTIEDKIEINKIVDRTMKEIEIVEL
jgi:thiamine biosynthesis protein ThiI